MDTDVVDFQPVSDASAYVLRHDFSLWFEPTRFAYGTMVDTNVLDMQAVGSVVYMLDPDANLWREPGTSGARAWVLGQDGTLWRELGDSSTRTLVDQR